MKDGLTEIADALDTLADVSDRMDELAGHNASFWRDAAAGLRQIANEKTHVADVIDWEEHTGICTPRTT